MLTLNADQKFVRLPSSKQKCPITGFSRAYFYQLEKSGALSLLHIKRPGKQRGITLIPLQELNSFLERCANQKGVRL